MWCARPLLICRFLFRSDQAQENVGMAMGYTIAESLKEWLADNNVPSAVDG